MIGALDIELAMDRRRPDWRLTLAGGADIARCVVGRPAAEVAVLLPRVFNLCAAAHTEAAAAALGMADDHPTRREEAARQERAREHVLAIACDWPAILGQEPQRALLRMLAGGADGMKTLRTSLLGTEIALAEGTPQRLDHWLRAGASPTARLLAFCRGNLDPAWGRAELARPDLPEIAAALDAGSPAAPRETTAADAWRDAPLIRTLLGREGASLFVRMLARLLDLIDCLDPRRERGGALPAGASAGIGLSRAARGLLAHRARVEDGIVTDYRVLSPSAWNLAAGGLLPRALAALPIRAETPMLARLVVSCVDPCVPVRLRLGAMGGA